MSDILGVVMHHDAITGTERHYVNDDYNLRLNNAERETRDLYLAILRDYIYKTTGIFID